MGSPLHLRGDAPIKRSSSGGLHQLGESSGESKRWPEGGHCSLQLGLEVRKERGGCGKKSRGT